MPRYQYSTDPVGSFNYATNDQNWINANRGSSNIIWERDPFTNQEIGSSFNPLTNTVQQNPYQQNSQSNTSNVYNTSSLGNTNVNIPQPSTNNYDNIWGTLNSSIGSTSSSLNSFLSQFDQITQPAEQERTGLVNRMNTAIDKLVGRGKRTQELMTQQQLPQSYEQLKALNTQMAERQAAYTAGIQKVEGKTIPMAFITGQQAQMQKMQNIELGNMATLAQALQGNIELSRQMINDTVNLEYAPIEQEIENLKYQLTVNAENMTSAEKKRAEALNIALTERQSQIETEKQEKTDIKNLAVEAARNGASTDIAQRMMNAKTMSEAMGIGGNFLQKAEEAKNKYMSVGKDSAIFDTETGKFIFNAAANSELASTSDKLTTIAAIGKSIYGTKISDAETAFITKIIDAKMSENPNITNAELRVELMKQLTGFNVTKNEDIAQGLLDTILQSSGEDGISNFDMSGLSQLLNNNNVAGAITKVENYALDQQRKADPTNYFGESGAATTVTFANNLAQKIQELGGIGNFQGSIEKWLGRFKGTKQQAIAADIVNMMADWRKKFAGSAVTPTEMEFLADTMPSITDRADQIAIKLDSLQSAALTMYNQTRSAVNLPQLDEEALLNKGKRANLYTQPGETQQSDIITPEYQTWFDKKYKYQSADPYNEKILFKYYKEKNPGIADDVIRQTIEENLSGFNQDLSKSGNGSEVKRIASAIGQFESGGNYKAKGPTVTSGMYKGDNAYGKYQIMGKNIPQWSKEALGRSITLKEFLNNPKLQDKIAEYKMGNIYKQYGNVEDVASVWFSGRPVKKAGNAKDVLGTTVPKYIKNVRSIYNNLG